MTSARILFLGAAIWATVIIAAAPGRDHILACLDAGFSFSHCEAWSQNK